MGIMTMNMSQGNIEGDMPATTEYDDEIMCSGWNPVIALSHLLPEDKHKSFPAEIVGLDLDSFLHKMYG